MISTKHLRYLKEQALKSLKEMRSNQVGGIAGDPTLGYSFYSNNAFFSL
jgi:hypothetical protein